MSLGISVIIPTYNGKELLKQNLPFIINECKRYRGESEIIVVDDAGDDGTFEFVSSSFPAIKVLRRVENGGFAKTANTGVLEAKFPLVFLLNNDVKVSADILDKLTEHFSDKRVFAVQPRIVSDDGKREDVLGEIYEKFGFFSYKYKKAEIKSNECQKVDFVSGGAAVFDRVKFISLGLFDDKFSPFYFEDLDLCFRAKMFQYDILYLPSVEVFHLHPGSTVKKLFSAFKWNFIHKRNYFRFVFKNSVFLKIFPVYWATALIYALFKMFRGNLFFVLGFFAAFFTSVSLRKNEFCGNNILYADNPINPPGGGQKSLLALIENIKKFYNPVVIIGSKGETEYELKMSGIPVYPVNISKFNFLISIFRILSLVRMTNPKIIHSNSPSTFFSFIIAIAAKIKKIPFVWHVRVSDSAKTRDSIMAALSTKIIVISDEVRNKFNPRWRPKIVKIRNAVDSLAFSPSGDCIRLKQNMGIKQDEKIIGMFSRFVGWKGHDLFLEMAKILSEKNLSCKFLLVGGGENFEHIKKKVHSLRIRDSIIMTGYVDKPASLMNLCDIVVNPSINPEPFGRIVIEAMSLGKVVVATDMGGPREIIQNGEDGFLVEANAVKIAETVFKVLTNVDAGEKIKTNAVKKFKEMFTIDKQVGEVLSVYENLLKDYKQ